MDLEIPNLKNIDERFLIYLLIGNEYSVPYFWGTVGIVYNPSLLEAGNFVLDDLWAERFERKYYWSMEREVIGFGLNSLNYSLNDTNIEHLQEAKRN